MSDCFLLKNVPTWLSLDDLLMCVNAENAAELCGRRVEAADRMLGMHKVILRTPCTFVDLRLPVEWRTRLEMSVEPYVRKPPPPRAHTDVLLVQCLLADGACLSVPDMLACLDAMCVDATAVRRVFSSRMPSLAVHRCRRTDPNQGRKLAQFYVQMASVADALSYLPSPDGPLRPVIDALPCAVLQAHLHVLQTSATSFDSQRRPCNVWNVPERITRGFRSFADERRAMLGNAAVSPSYWVPAAPFPLVPLRLPFVHNPYCLGGQQPWFGMVTRAPVPVPGFPAAAACQAGLQPAIVSRKNMPCARPSPPQGMPLFGAASPASPSSSREPAEMSEVSSEAGSPTRGGDDVSHTYGDTSGTGSLSGIQSSLLNPVEITGSICSL